MPKALTLKEDKFVRRYMRHGNATRAMCEAGYSKRTAASCGSTMLRKPKIAKELARRRKISASKMEVTRDNVLTEMARVAFSDVAGLVDSETGQVNLEEVPTDLRRAISGIDVEDRTSGRGEDAERYTVTKVRLWPKATALEQLGKHLGLFEKDHEQAGAASAAALTALIEQQQQGGSVAPDSELGATGGMGD